MAHVKVVRRSMNTDEWISLRFSWLSQMIVRDSEEIEGFKIREGRQTAENDYEWYDDTYRPLNKGDLYFTPDGSSFLKAEVEIPERFLSGKIYLELKTAAEMIVKINGVFADGIDPNRTRMLLSPYLNDGNKCRIEIEGYNRSKPDDDRNIETRGMKGCRQHFDGARLITVNDEIQAAVYDVQILIEAKDTRNIDENIRDLIRSELDSALNYIDYDLPGNENLENAQLLREQLKAKVFSLGLKSFGKVALVSHSHLDIAYYWRRMHAVQKNARTCLIQLRLMDRYPEFHYCHTQPFLYETLEKNYPEIFSMLKERIAQGRFEPAGAMYVEPDCNIPTAESLVRQCLYGQLLYREKFGITVENCWLPDVFGNSWILPQILKKSGVKYFVSNKMSTWNDTNLFPHNHFVWRGIDGSDIYACVPPTHFITWNTPGQILENWEQFQDKDACKETLSMFGYGDGGSGATDQMLEYERRLDELPGMPEIRHIRGDKFLKENFDDNDKLSVWDGELYLEMHRGTFTSKAMLKKENRELELLLRDTELLCTAAAAYGFEYPSERIRQLWKLLLVNQFHDILPGSHIAPVTRDALKDYASVRASLQEIIADAVVVFRHTTDKKSVVTVYNSFSFERKGPTFIGGDYGQTVICGIPSQIGEFKGKKGIWIDDDTIQPLSSKQYELCEAAKAENDWFSFENRVISTPFYWAEFEADGSIISLFDKQNNRELVNKGESLNKLVIYNDNPGMYDAWDILPNYKDKTDSYETVGEIRVCESGSVFVQLEVCYRLRHSDWKQKISFYKESNRIDFSHCVDWHERNKLAKMLFRFNILARTAKCDTSAGTIVRETHQNTSWQKARFEVCSHKWVDLSETGYGIAVINESKYGVSLEQNTVGLSLLRAPIRPDPYSDEGMHQFSYALLPHTGTPEEAGIMESAWLYNSPMQAFDFEAEIQFPIVQVKENLHIQSVKQSECGDGSMILRLVELKGQRGMGTVTFSKEIAAAESVNMLEDQDLQIGCSFDGRVLEFEYGPFEIKTFKIVLQ